MALGTIACMSPEQVRGQALDARMDLFSLGVVLYEMATGRRPFEEKHVRSCLRCHSEQGSTAPIRLNSLLPSELERVTNKALEKDPKFRYQSASDLCADLQRLKRDRDSDALSRPWSQSPRTFRRLAVLPLPT